MAGNGRTKMIDRGRTSGFEAVRSVKTPVEAGGKSFNGGRSPKDSLRSMPESLAAEAAVLSI